MDSCDLAFVFLRQALGLDIDADADLYAVGTGTGLALAAADHLSVAYPDLRIQALDLPGSWGVEKRTQVLDYLFQAGPVVFCCWAGLAPADTYPIGLKMRGFGQKRYDAWVYVRGMNAEVAAGLWQALGVVVISDLWQPQPLGNLGPSHSLPRAGFARAEC